MIVKATIFRWTQGKIQRSRLCRAGRNKVKVAEAEGHLHCATRNKQWLYVFKCLICKHQGTGVQYSNACSNNGELKPTTEGEDTLFKSFSAFSFTSKYPSPIQHQYRKLS